MILPVATSTTLQLPKSGAESIFMVQRTVIMRSAPALTGPDWHFLAFAEQLAADAEFASPASAHRVAVIRTVFRVFCISMIFTSKQKLYAET